MLVLHHPNDKLPKVLPRVGRNWLSMEGECFFSMLFLGSEEGVACCFLSHLALKLKISTDPHPISLCLSLNSPKTKLSHVPALSKFFPNLSVTHLSI